MTTLVLIRFVSLAALFCLILLPAIPATATNYDEAKAGTYTLVDRPPSFP